MSRPTGAVRSRAWLPPRLHSVQVPVVEELLAQSYRQKAEMWAKAAKLSREQR